MPPPPLLPRLSSTTRIAAHAMIEIAEAQGRVVAAATIVRNQRLPDHFLDQLLGKLRRAGLLRSVRGPRGGYTLSRPATAISLADIVEAVDAPPSPRRQTAVTTSGAAPSSTRSSTRSHPAAFLEPETLAAGCPSACAVEQAWWSASAAMHEVMCHTTLAALVASKHALEHHPVGVEPRAYRRWPAKLPAFESAL
ncbi:MAG: Rrf2 family transcriptional regulator [Chloroflexi bacterium]|nr:Rrf2 family transcriptional regulator [Chloroflexota bacterium]